MDKYDKILITHYGKVASTTLHAFLEKALDCNAATIKSNRENFNEKILSTFENYMNVVNYHKKRNDKILVISVCRNLINRWVSMYFQMNGIKLYNEIKKNDAVKEKKFQYIKNRVIKKNFYLDGYFMDLKKNLDLDFDIFESYDRNKKYIYKEGNNIDFLLLTFEDIQNWPSIFDTLFKLKVELVNENIGIHKMYSQLYKEFKEYLQNSEDYKICEKKFKKTKHYKYFYFGD